MAGATLRAILDGRPHSCETAANGRCEIAGLEQGECWIIPDARQRDGLAPASIRARLDGTVERGVQIRWPKARARLTVRVYGRDGKEMGTAAIVFPGAPSLSEALDANRTAVIPYHVVPAGRPLENLSADRYTVVAFDGWRKACALAVIELKCDEREVTLRLDDGCCR